MNSSSNIVKACVAFAGIIVTVLVESFVGDTVSFSGAEDPVVALTPDLTPDALASTQVSTDATPSGASESLAELPRVSEGSAPAPPPPPPPSWKVLGQADPITRDLGAAVALDGQISGRLAMGCQPGARTISVRIRSDRELDGESVVVRVGDSRGRGGSNWAVDADRRTISYQGDTRRFLRDIPEEGTIAVEASAADGSMATHLFEFYGTSWALDSLTVLCANRR